MKTILLNMFILFIMFFVLSMYSFCSKSNHVLMMLLSLEMMSLFLFFLFLIIFWNFSEKYILMYYLTFCVCEGAFGLSILVMLVRSTGNDYLKSMMFMKC